MQDAQFFPSLLRRANMHRLFCAALAALLAAACAGQKPGPEPTQAPAPSEAAPAPPPRLVQVSLTALPNWDADDPAPALTAFQTVCRRFKSKAPSAAVSPAWPELGTAGAWAAVCADAAAVPATSARDFIARRFVAYRLVAEPGLFTGYFEPEVPGSRVRGGPYQTPLYAKPDDIVTADLGAFSDKYQGDTILGRIVKGRFVPYHDRAAVVAGALQGSGLEIVWLADPVDGFFIEIQGSGRIALAEGGTMRVGYAGKNGRAYRAIGRDLIARGAVRREDMSMQAIRRWLADNPREAPALMNLNQSVVFFTERTGPGPVGAAGTPLTPMRSLAVDPAFVPLGGLVWLDVPHPNAGAPPIRRLVVAEDVGGAIKGAQRGDLFWGTGAQAGDNAGRMASQGQFYLLAPK